MGVRIEDHCCCCDLPCRGAACSLRHVPVAYCDKCGDEAEEFYEFGSDLLCEECFVEASLEKAEKVEDSEGCCEWCDEESKVRYLVDGDKVCRECFVESLLDSSDLVSADKVVDNYDDYDD